MGEQERARPAACCQGVWRGSFQACKDQDRAQGHCQGLDGVQPEAEGRGPQVVEREEGQEVPADGFESEEDAQDSARLEEGAGEGEDTETEDKGQQFSHAEVRCDHVSEGWRESTRTPICAESKKKK